MQGKRELVRVVRTPEGEVAVDPTGRRNGRGAYVHKSRECWEMALKRGALERALKMAITADVRRSLSEYGDSLPSAPPEVPPAEQTGDAAESAAMAEGGMEYES